MKRVQLTILILLSLLMAGSALATGNKADRSNRQVALVEFKDTVKLGAALLKGRYMIVHDDDKMAQGEDCTYVYSLRGGETDKLVVSFHCRPMKREKADHFSITVSSISSFSMLSELREYQFAGSSEGHALP